MKWNPHPYQEKALTFMLENPAAGLFLDPGLGKTSITLAALSIMKKQALVVAPLRVCTDVWPEEAVKWADFGHLKIEVLHGKYKEARASVNADIYVINPEGLPWLFDFWGKYDDWPEVLIIDESTKFKNTQTQRFKLLKPELPRFDRRYILTGTPSPNGLLDLFGQVYVLDLGATLGRFISHYRNQYFYQTGFGGFDWKPFPGAEEEIYSALKPYVMRLSAEDYLAMPKLITSRREVRLPKKARDIYSRLETDLVVKLEKGDVTAVNAGALTMKLRQLTNGLVYLEDQSEQEVHTQKADALEEIIEELSGQPLLVAYAFRSEAKVLSERFGAPIIGGQTSTAQSSKLIRKWNDGLLPVLFIHPASAGHGLNLQGGGRHLAWFGPTYDYEQYTQTIRRIWRQGQTKPVHVYQICAKDTVDEAIFRVLSKKGANQKKMFDALKDDLMGC